MFRSHQYLSYEYTDQRYYHQIRKDQMHVVKWLHLVCIESDRRIPWHITDGDFFERINRKYDRLKTCVCLYYTHDRPGNDYFGLGGIDGNESDHHNEQPIDANKVNARCDRHYAVVGNDDAYEI